MDFKPVVVEFNAPKTPLGSWRDKLPHFGPRGTKMMIIVISTIMIASMVSFAVFTVQSNNADFSKKHGLDANLPQSSGVDKNNASLPGGGVAVGIGGTTGKNAPSIELTAEPASVVQGQKSTLKWTVTNSPNTCTASDDWSGEKSKTTGSEQTQTLSSVQNYLFTLTCKTATGTAFKTVAVSVTAPNTSAPGSTSTATTGVPAVSIAAKPNLIFAGDSSTITWEATNNPSSCTASGDWSGTKAGSGSMSTGTLITAKTYTYTLLCKNTAGSSQSISAKLTVQTVPPGSPVVFLASTPPGPIQPGAGVTLSWTTENSPSSCLASGDWSGTKAVGGGSQQISNLSTIKEYVFTITCSNETGTIDDSATVQVLPSPPNVSLTVNPSSIISGQSSTLSWSATNSPTSCTASGSWSGAKASSGTQSTGALNAGAYAYNLSCTNAGGTGYANNVPLTVSTPPKPVITLSASPISVSVGGNSNLTWSATNSPTSCTASGSWSGAKASSGTQSTGALNTAQTFTYTLSCANAGGTGTASTSVTASSGGATNPPVVSISASPTSIGTGGSSTLSWSATNSPSSCTASGSWSGAKSASGTTTLSPTPAGTYTYSLSCNNAVGSGSASATITVIATPTVSVSVSPGTITAGSSTAVAWTTGNSPSSCTAGGTGWSGSKTPSGGSQSVVLAAAGTYTFTLTCSNSGGSTTSNTASVTVNAAVYCAGLTPCYSTADLNTHTSLTDCWSYNTSTASASNKSVYNITNFNNGWHRSRQNLLPGASSATALCGAKDFAAFIAGTNLSGVGSRNHATNTKQNSNTTLNAYRAGYYDATKP
ncbi:hypothetical protein IPL85_04015 [Candidatus Saccharibacteria bacterium]|nr:MAG: hypothetical protein IPL85_04015 [Candidatus Saccharibacteria bacterium]